MRQHIIIHSSSIAARFGIILAAVLLTATFGTTQALAADTTFSGQAAAIKVTVPGTSTSFSDTGPLPAEGGAREASLLDLTIPGGLGTVQVLHSTTVGHGGKSSSSDASIAELELNVGGNLIGAKFLRSGAR